MKFKMVALVLVASRPLISMSPDRVKENFKNELYKQQLSLMPNKDQYCSIIEPFLFQVERELTIAQRCVTHSEESKEYFQELLSFNGALLQQYCYPNSQGVKSRYEIARYCLKEFIKKYKYNCPDLNENNEFEKTESLFHKINETYYKELPWASKIFIYASRLFQ